MKTYLVTGGAGFIGSNFIKYLLQKHPDAVVINYDCLTYAGNLDNLRDIEHNPNYRFIKGDVCDFAAVTKVFAEYVVDYVIHFAAESHVDRSIKDPGAFVQTNVMGTINMLGAAKTAWQVGDDIYKEGVRFLQVSTDEVYGSLGAQGYFTETTGLDPHSPYSASKTSADLFVMAYASTYQLPVNITRCSNNYGAYQFPEKLIPLTIQRLLRHENVPVYGDGLQVRDWLFVEDHCKAIDMVCTGGTIGEIYNVGGHNERTNIEIVRQIIRWIKENHDSAVGEHQIEYVRDRKGHDRRYGIDASKLKDELGWYPETAFEDGICKTVQWYISNTQWLENLQNREQP